MRGRILPVRLGIDELLHTLKGFREGKGDIKVETEGEKEVEK